MKGVWGHLVLKGTWETSAEPGVERWAGHFLLRAFTGLKKLKPLGFMNFLEKFSVSLSIINYREKLLSIKRPPLPKHWTLLDPGHALRPEPARGAAGWQQCQLLRKGRFIQSDLPALQLFPKCALLRCCYLTAGIRPCSPAGSAAVAHWQVGAIDAVPTGLLLCKGHVRLDKVCRLPFKNSRNQIFSVTVTNKATGDVLQLNILLQIRAAGKTFEVTQERNKKVNKKLFKAEVF